MIYKYMRVGHLVCGAEITARKNSTFSCPRCGMPITIGAAEYTDEQLIVRKELAERGIKRWTK